MKTPKKPATSKMITRFDIELKNLLIEDIKTFKEKNQFLNNNVQVIHPQQLSAA